VNRAASRILANTVALLATAFFAFPVYWMVVSAFKPREQLQTYVPVFIPTAPTLDSFARAVGVQYFGDFLRNSLVVAGSTVLLSLVVGFLAAVAVARMKFRGRRAFLVLVAIVQVAPFEVVLIPMFLTMNDFGLYNNIISLVIIYFIFSLPFTIWSLRGFISSVPVELEEAAMVDGSSRLGAFMRVTLPLVAPGIVASAMFCFITAWNEYLYAFTLMADQQNYTLPVWLAQFKTNFGTDWGATMAASTLITLPVLILFLLLQRRLVSGLTAGAVRG
jgi:N,N'-diacetylchitobiose transport system permease protein